MPVEPVTEVSVMVVDNHAATARGVELLAAETPGLRPVGAYESVPVDLLHHGEAPDVVVLDLYLGRDDTPSTRWIPALVEWGAAVVLHTSAETPVPLRQAVAAGASGLSLKNDGLGPLLDTVRAVARGEFACSSVLARALLEDDDLVASLTPREVEVVSSLDQGLTHQQVANRLGVALSTVRQHLKSVRAKYVDLGRAVSNAHSFTREARRDGWIDPRAP